jgi:hypothetical protein
MDCISFSFGGQRLGFNKKMREARRKFNKNRHEFNEGMKSEKNSHGK